MANGIKNLNLKSETFEFMDHPSMQHEHVVTIPPTIDASSITSSSAATIGSQTLDLPLVTLHESVPIDVSTSNIVNTQGQSPTPRRRSHLWNNLCSWRAFDFYSTSIQIILMIVFLSIFRDEHPHVALQVWTIGYGVVCLASLPLLYCTYKCSRDDSLFPNLEDDEFETHQHQRSRKILRCLWGFVDGFFVLWFFFGIGIIGARWASKEALHLSRLCTAFLVFDFLRFVLPWTFYFVLEHCDYTVWPQRAETNVISSLPTYKFHAQVSDLESNQASNKEDVSTRDLTRGDPRIGAPTVVVECCVCLDLYEEGVELKLLPCTHHFHVKCIDQWLKINGSCPICKNEVDTSNRVSEMDLTYETITI